jgi:hypothetical protein
VKGFATTEEFYVAFHQYHENGAKGDPPRRDHIEFTLIETLASLLPNVSFGPSPASGGPAAGMFPLTAARGSSRWSASEMSMGEQEVIGHVAQLLVGTQNGDVFLVDEPELHLHSAQAALLWGLIESLRPDSIFVYATHDVSFAMRDAVDTRLVVVEPGKPVVPIASAHDLPVEVERELLGAIPGMLRAGKVLVTEGTQTSVDREFYPWVLGMPDLVVEPLGGSNSVRSAMKFAHPLLKVLAGRAQVVGVVDRDFQTKPGDGNHAVIALREAESYLCHPQLLRDWAMRLQEAGLIDRAPSEQEFLQRLVSYCEPQIPYVASQRAIRATEADIKFSAATDDYEGLVDAGVASRLRVEAGRHLKALRHRLRNIKTVAETELEECRKAVADPIKMLTLFPIKDYFWAQVAALNVKRDRALKSIRKLHVEDYQHLRELREQLRNAWHGA